MWHTGGEVAASLTNQTWEQLLTTRLLAPLGMVTTTPLVDAGSRRNAALYARARVCV